MTAAELLAAAAADSYGRLKWCVLQRLGICPVSLRARLLTRRGVLRCACRMILDAEATTGGAGEENPNFDAARFEKLAGGGETRESI